MDRTLNATRAVGLARLEAFTPAMGQAYAARRNTDFGRLTETATSALSPYLRRRLVLEREAVDAALAAHGPVDAEKFIQEVFWRTYFKGHLETRPALWTAYQHLVAQEQQRLASQSGFRRAFEQAVAGRTGIDGFDDWAQELIETNWLHNHARMWFASIWIFTLRLPWALGADFFMRHLIDGDPASNTLSWRWVAGLHTRGKPYAARAENIRRYTDGRFDPAGLNEHPVALEEAEPAAAISLPPADAAPEGDVALLLHLDDLHPESLPLGRARVVRVGGLLAHAEGAVGRVRDADRTAMADALARAAAHFGCAAEPVDVNVVNGGAVKSWTDGLSVVAPWAPVGPSATALPGCIRIRREWDSLGWPRANRGFFQVKAAIPTILEATRP